VAGAAHLTQFDSTTGILSTSIISSEIVTAASLDVTVDDRGLTSNVAHLTVARPVIGSLVPPSTTAGSTGFTLVLHGSAFLLDVDDHLCRR